MLTEAHTHLLKVKPEVKTMGPIETTEDEDVKTQLVVDISFSKNLGWLLAVGVGNSG